MNTILGGWVKAEIIRPTDITRFAVSGNEIICTANSESTWQTLDLQRGSIDLSCKSEDGDAGVIYELNISMNTIGYDLPVIPRQAILRLTRTDNTQWIVGTKELPLTTRIDAGNDKKGSDFVGCKISLQNKQFHPQLKLKQ